MGELKEMADQALALKPFSVTDKLETPPSGMPRLSANGVSPRLVGHMAACAVE